MGLTLALTMEHLLAAPQLSSTFLFRSVISATQDGMMTPDKITTRDGN